MAGYDKAVSGREFRPAPEQGRDRACPRHPGSLAELCDRLLAQVGPATIDDDIALMAIRPAVT
jgi:hypothetical protein